MFIKPLTMNITSAENQRRLPFATDRITDI